MSMRMILVDGLELQVADAAAPVIQRTIQSLETQLRDAKKKIKEKEDEDEERDEDEAKKDAALKAKDRALTETNKALEIKDGEIAALRKQLDEARKQSSPQALDAMARERSEVMMKAQKLVGDRLKMDGLSVADIRRAVVDAKIGNCKDWSDDRVCGAFDAMDGGAFGKGSVRGSNIDDAVVAFGRPGAGYMTPSQARDEALAKYNEEMSNAWRNPKPAA